jgi:hypothetical protein
VIIFAALFSAARRRRNLGKSSRSVGFVVDSAADRLCAVVLVISSPPESDSGGFVGDVQLTRWPVV